MVVTSVSVNLVTKKPRLRGTASVVFENNFKVTEILILQSKPGGELYVVMPCKYFGKPDPKTGKQKRKNVAYPINQEFLAYIKAAVLEEYARKLELLKEGRSEAANANTSDKSDFGHENSAAPGSAEPAVQNPEAPPVDNYDEED